MLRVTQIILALTVSGLALPVMAQEAQLTVKPQLAAKIISPIDYSPYDAFMERLSKEEKGRLLIAYDYARENATAFMNSYAAFLAAQDASQLSKDDQLAYWLNLQNFLAVKAIAEESKGRKLSDERGTIAMPGPVWTKPRVAVAGKIYSLADIERKIVTEFDNPNIIYGIYQGVKGSPCLTPKAYRGATVNDMLAKYAKTYVNAKGSVDVDDNVVEVTPIFTWYQQDVFGSDDADLVRHIQAYADAGLKDDLKRVDRFETVKLNYRIDKLRLNTRQNAFESNPATYSDSYSRPSVSGYGS